MALSSLGRGLRGRLLGVVLEARARNGDTHYEFVDALTPHRRGLDLDQARILQLRRGLEVAHERRHPRLRLGEAGNDDAAVGLPDALEVDAVRQLPHQLIEQVHRLGAVALERFHHALAREQRRGLLLELLDLGDLLVELDDLLLQVLVAAELHLVLLVQIGVDDEPDTEPDDDNAAEQEEELLLLLLAPDLAMRQQVDADHGSNLRMARPQATMSDGASCVSDFALIFPETCMFTNGFAMMVFTWTRFETASSTPGIAALPPESTMWWIWLCCVEVKKNCRARATSRPSMSMNGCSTSAS